MDRALIDKLATHIVDRYLVVDVAVVRGIVEGHLDDLLAFARSVRARLDQQP